MFWAPLRANRPASGLPCTFAFFFHFVRLTYPLKKTLGTRRTAPPTGHVPLPWLLHAEGVGGERQQSGVTVSYQEKNRFYLLILPRLFGSCPLLGARIQRSLTSHLPSHCFSAACLVRAFIFFFRRPPVLLPCVQLREHFCGRILGFTTHSALIRVNTLSQSCYSDNLLSCYGTIARKPSEKHSTWLGCADTALGSADTCRWVRSRAACYSFYFIFFLNLIKHSYLAATAFTSSVVQVLGCQPLKAISNATLKKSFQMVPAAVPWVGLAWGVFVSVRDTRHSCIIKKPRCRLHLPKYLHGNDRTRLFLTEEFQATTNGTVFQTNVNKNRNLPTQTFFWFIFFCHRAHKRPLYVHI